MILCYILSGCVVWRFTIIYHTFSYQVSSSFHLITLPSKVLYWILCYFIKRYSLISIFTSACFVLYAGLEYYRGSAVFLHRFVFLFQTVVYNFVLYQAILCHGIPCMYICVVILLHYSMLDHVFRINYDIFYYVRCYDILSCYNCLYFVMLYCVVSTLYSIMAYCIIWSGVELDRIIVCFFLHWCNILLFCLLSICFWIRIYLSPTYTRRGIRPPQAVPRLFIHVDKRSLADFWNPPTS